VIARVIALMLSVAAAHAQMSITGRVLDPTGFPIPVDGLVIWTMQEGVPESLRSQMFTTHTRNGEFEVASLPPGSWKIVVTCGGFLPAVFKVDLSLEHPRIELGIVILKIGRVTEGNWFETNRGTKRR
jgi:hypothetical protein